MKELEQEIERLTQENQELRQRVHTAEALIKQLLEQLGQNSKNSHWSPSRDKSRSKPKSQRQKSDRKAGGQKGHQGHTLEMVAEPDVVAIHRPESCHHCQQPFDLETTAVQVTKRQVLDLPPLHLMTTEHQVETIRCPHCEEVTAGQFPAEVTQSVQYGPQVKRLAVYLRCEQFVPYERSRQLLADVFNLRISTGSLQNFVAHTAQTVAPLISQIKAALTACSVAHADETGCYITGRRYWLHTVSTPTLTHFAVQKGRGYKAMAQTGILPQFSGILVHDALASYFLCPQAEHALCHAHHLRDLSSITENTPQRWVVLMRDFLLAAKQQVSTALQAGDSHFPPEQLALFEQLYDSILSIGEEENPLPDRPPPEKRRGRPKKSKARNLLERFIKHKVAMLRFIRDFKVPFDNNLAERDIRMMKVQQKVSGCFRSWEGAQQFCLLRSYISTIRKQGLNVWEAIGSLFPGAVLVPNLTPV